MADQELSDIAQRYQDINNILTQLYKKLYRKLRRNEVALSAQYREDFTTLINHIGRIPAIERYYDTNIKPDDEIIFQNGQNISLKEYNLLLTKKINFYIRLIGYYLALKGVPIQSINNATTLDQRIDLIDQIDKLLLVVFIVDIPEKNYIGEYINVHYEIKGLQNETVTDGIIEVYYGDTLVKRVDVGEPLKFLPIEIVGRNNYYFVFSKSSKYQATRLTKRILVVDKDTITQVFLLTDNNLSDTDKILSDSDGRLYIPYITDDINHPVHVLTDMYIDNEEELCLEYEEYESVDFETIDKGVIDIGIGKDEEWNPCIEYLTIQGDETEDTSP